MEQHQLESSRTGPHKKEATKHCQFSAEEKESKSLELQGVQSDTKPRIKIKFIAKNEPISGTDTYLVSSPRISTSITCTENSRPKDHTMRKKKRKTHRMESPLCEECGKLFPSLKSKYGHMRCHSNRDPRKIRRSPTKLLTWSVRGRRCQTPIFSEESCIAADILIQMSRDNSPLNGDQVSNIGMNRTESRDTKFEVDSKEPEDFGTIDKYGSSKIYQCSFCKMSFATYQALGGHTASHNKNKSNVEEAIVVESIGAELASTGDGIDLGYTVSKAPTMVHECTICHLTFPSGQALGGHKRKHYTGFMAHATNTTLSNSPTESFGENTETKIRVVLDVDLNLEPPDEEFS